MDLLEIKQFKIITTAQIERTGGAMLRIAIVEDEENYISVLKDYLERYKRESGEQIEVTVYHDGDEIAAFYKAQFDIILMDIEMKFIDGMTAAEEIRKSDASVAIIFITNAPQYAIRGYEVGALGLYS